MPKFIPFDFPRTLDNQYMAVLTDGRILYYRRQQLGLTQQQVAQMSKVPLRQYQRMEAGETDLGKNCFEYGLAICTVLMLDPYDFLCQDIVQPDVRSLKPIPPLNIQMPPEEPRKRGRQPLRKDIMTVCLTVPNSSLEIPCCVLNALGNPACIQIMAHEEQRRIVLRAVHKDAEALIESGMAFDVPEQVYDGDVLVIPSLKKINDIIRVMKWEEAREAESRLVTTREGEKAILIDLNKAIPSDGIQGKHVMPACCVESEI